jgi:hypothetical protein
MKITIGDDEAEAIFGVGTLAAYEEEFGRDLIQDLFGKVRVEDPDKQGDDVLYTIDYTQTNWTALLRATWAGVSVADPATPPFKEWAKGIGEINLNELMNQVVPVCIRQFFRPQGR